MSCHRAKWRENCVVRIKRKLRPRCGPFRAKYLSVSGFFCGGWRVLWGFGALPEKYLVQYLTTAGPTSQPPPQPPNSLSPDLQGRTHCKVSRGKIVFYSLRDTPSTTN